jgi:hypothetical protein
MGHGALNKHGLRFPIDQQDRAFEGVPLKDDADNSRVELASRTSDQFKTCLLDRQRLSVWAVGQHGVDRIAQHDYPSCERYFLTPQTGRIAITVKPLMVMPYCADDVDIDGAKTLKEVGTFGRMSPNQFNLCWIQIIRLPNHSFVDGIDLSNVMQEGSRLDAFSMTWWKQEVVSDSARERRDPQ